MQRHVTLIGLGAVVAAAACGEPFGIVSGSGGTGGNAGSSSGTMATSSSTGASGGTGGMTPKCEPGVLGECGAGMYCESTTKQCRACDDFSRLQFSAATPVMISPDTTGTTAFYPRIAADDGRLFFARKYKQNSLPVRQIAQAILNSKKDGWTMWSELDPPINSPSDESGPLWLPDGSILENLVDQQKVNLSEPVLLFDSNRDGLTTYKIFAANPSGTEAAEVGLPTGKRDTDVAAAPLANPPRFYWLSDANSTLGQQRLVTATATSQATPVSITFDNGCTAGNVTAPWVTPDGRHLFFAAAYPDQAGCMASLSAPLRLFHVRMTDSGMPAGDPAVAVFPDDTTHYDSTPALDPQGCMLMFARFDASASGHLAYALRD
jgi:hypothetical protein